MELSNKRKPIFWNPDEGKNLCGACFKLEESDTTGKFSLYEARFKPGKGPNLHVHEHQDECFIIIEGEFEFFVDGQSFQAQAGSVVFIPMNTPHRFVNTSQAIGRFYNVLSPGPSHARGESREKEWELFLQKQKEIIQK